MHILTESFEYLGEVGGVTTSTNERPVMESTFVFDGNQNVRTVEKDGETWFVAADVCQALGIKQHRVAIKVLDEDERAYTNFNGQRQVSVISESGLYIIMLRSNGALKPGTITHRFKRWVTHEVLPSIRKTGHYDSMHIALAKIDLPMNAPPDVMDAMWRLRFELDKRHK